MRFATAKEHRDYYEKNGYIAFDSLLTSAQLEVLTEGLHKTVEERAMTPALRLRRQFSDVKFAVGRDIWRSHEGAKKIILQKGLAEVASDLFQTHPLRIIYDQFLPSRGKFPASTKEEESYSQLLGLNASLEEMSAYQGIVGGIIICLKALEETENPLFSSKEGLAVFIHPQHVIDFSPLQSTVNGEYLLIVYGQKKTVYIKNERDPHVNHLRNLGYQFGDRLSDNIHPYILR
jgi:hypothetical protein